MCGVAIQFVWLVCTGLFLWDSCSFCFIPLHPYPPPTLSLLYTTPPHSTIHQSVNVAASRLFCTLCRRRGPSKKSKKGDQKSTKKKSSGGKGPTLTWLCYLMSWRESDLGKEIEHLAEVRH